MSQKPKTRQTTFKAKAEYPAVAVEWMDACFSDGYLKDGMTYTPGILCWNIGMLVDETPEFYCIAQSIDEAGKLRHLWDLPKGWVRKITYLQEKKGRGKK